MLEETNVSVEFGGEREKRGMDEARKTASVGESRGKKKGKERMRRRRGLRGWGGGGEKEGLVFHFFPRARRTKAIVEDPIVED